MISWTNLNQNDSDYQSILRAQLALRRNRKNRKNRNRVISTNPDATAINTTDFSTIGPNNRSEASEQIQAANSNTNQGAINSQESGTNHDRSSNHDGSPTVNSALNADSSTNLSPSRHSSSGFNVSSGFNANSGFNDGSDIDSSSAPIFEGPDHSAQWPRTTPLRWQTGQNRSNFSSVDIKPLKPPAAPTSVAPVTIAPVTIAPVTIAPVAIEPKLEGNQTSISFENRVINLLNRLAIGFETGFLDYSALSREHQKLSKLVLKRTRSQPREIVPLPELEGTQIVILKPGPITNSAANTMPNHRSLASWRQRTKNRSKTTNSAEQQLYHLTSALVAKVKNRQLPSLDLDQLIEISNKLRGDYPEIQNRPNPLVSSEGIFINHGLPSVHNGSASVHNGSADSHDDSSTRDYSELNCKLRVPIVLDRIVYLTNYGSDLTQFSEAQLKEIAIYLETLNQTRFGFLFEQLRFDLAQQRAKLKIENLNSNVESLQFQ